MMVDNVPCWTSSMLDFPHKCHLSTLQNIQRLFLLKRVPKRLFDEWMSINGGDYQLGVSDAAFRLWDEVTQYKPNREWTSKPNIKTAKGSRAIAIARCPKHNAPHVRIIWKNVRSRKDLKPLNDIWGYSSEPDRSKTTADAASILWRCKVHKLTSAVDKMLPYISLDYRNVTATFMILQAIGNPHVEAYIRILRSYHLCCMSWEDYPVVCKSISTAVRRTGKWPTTQPATLEEVASTAYWELAIGRSLNRTDWEEEKEKRTKARVWLAPPMWDGDKTADSNAFYLKGLEDDLVGIMAELIPEAPVAQSWTDFVLRRQEWVSSGSSGGYRVMVDGKYTRTNKHAMFEHIPTSEVMAWLDSEPCIKAVGSEKMEAGKARAIYGSKPCDYTVMAYAFGGVERKLYNIQGVESGKSGFDELACIYRRVLRVSGTGTECTMVDYTDFNYQHTPEVQALLFTTLANRYRQLGAHPDLVRAAEWSAAASLNQKVQFPGDPEFYSVTQGMFSGQRGTNFINTILNVAYYRYAARFTSMILGVLPIDVFTIHQGDDVWISNRSRLWAMVLFAVLQSVGLRFQPSKQLFDVDKGEFLRVLYTKAGMRGFLARAVATLIIKPIQGLDSESPSARAGAVSKQINVLVRRGFTPAAAVALWHAIVPYAASPRIKNSSNRVPTGILYKRVQDGGVNIGPCFTLAVPANRTKPLPTLDPASEELAAALPMHMTNDWLHVVSQQVGTAFNIEPVREAMHNTNMCDSLRAEDKQVSLLDLDRRMTKWFEEIKDIKGERSANLYKRYFDGAVMNQAIRDRIQMLEVAVLFPDLHLPARTQLDSIVNAIAASPFRDLATTITATGLHRNEALEFCFRLCTRPDLANLARIAVHRLRTMCSEAVLSAVLDEVQVETAAFESQWHPCVLSWCNLVALQSAYEIACSQRISTKSQWIGIMEQEFHCVMGTVHLDGRLELLSHY